MMGDDGVIIHIGAITSVSKFRICKGEDDEKNVVIKVNRYSVDLCIGYAIGRARKPDRQHFVVCLRERNRD